MKNNKKKEKEISIEMSNFKYSKYQEGDLGYFIVNVCKMQDLEDTIYNSNLILEEKYRERVLCLHRQNNCILNDRQKEKMSKELLKIKNLKGAPKEIKGCFDISGTGIVDTKNMPSNISELKVNNCNSLVYLFCPQNSDEIFINKCPKLEEIIGKKINVFNNIFICDCKMLKNIDQITDPEGKCNLSLINCNSLTNIDNIVIKSKIINVNNITCHYSCNCHCRRKEAIGNAIFFCKNCNSINNICVPNGFHTVEIHNCDGLSKIDFEKNKTLITVKIMNNPTLISIDGIDKNQIVDKNNYKIEGNNSLLYKMTNLEYIKQNNNVFVNFSDEKQQNSIKNYKKGQEEDIKEKEKQNNNSIREKIKKKESDKYGNEQHTAKKKKKNYKEDIKEEDIKEEEKQNNSIKEKSKRKESDEYDDEEKIQKTRNDIKKKRKKEKGKKEINNKIDNNIKSDLSSLSDDLDKSFN